MNEEQKHQLIKYFEQGIEAANIGIQRLTALLEQLETEEHHAEALRADGTIPENVYNEWRAVIASERDLLEQEIVNLRNSIQHMQEQIEIVRRYG